MLKRDDAVLIFIDVQGKLHEIMDEKVTLDGNLIRLVKCAKLLDVPIVATEQIPEKLGSTNEPFNALLADAPMISKSAFSCCGEPKFMQQLERLGRQQFILIGIETHVCVYQTAIDLLEFGSEVFVAADAVASRNPGNKTLTLQAMREAGAHVLPTEALLFALLRDASDPRFKALLQLIK